MTESPWYQGLVEDTRSPAEVAADIEAFRARQTMLLERRKDEVDRYRATLIDEALIEYRSEIEDPQAGMVTGFHALDKALQRPIRKGEVIIFAARTGVGKTWWCDHLTDRHLFENQAAFALYLNLEMPTYEMGHRALTWALDVPPGEVDERAANQRIPWDTVVDDSMPHRKRMGWLSRPGIQVGEFDKVIGAATQRGMPPSILVVDYVGLLGGKERTTYERASQIAKDLKDFALSMDVVILAAVQISRAGGGAGDVEPELDSLRDSGVIEEAADRVMLAWRMKDEDDDGDQVMFVKVAKNRHGRVGGRVILRFTPAMRLEVIDESELYRIQGAD